MRSALLAGALASAACDPAARPVPAEGHEQTGEVDATEARDSLEARASRLLEPPVLRTVLSEPVEGRLGPGEEPFEVALRTAGNGRHTIRRTGMKDFSIAMRQEPLERFPCSSCHLPDGTVIGEERIPDAHAEVQPIHPAETGARCATCHNARDMDRLALAGGESAGFDHAYRLCAQCHFAQVEAWAGGAHGKRLDGWAGRRVVLGCTECHDPHRPVTEIRIPFRAPRFPADGARDR